jgi:hypothetical protein
MAFDESICAEDHQGEECQANYQVIKADYQEFQKVKNCVDAVAHVALHFDRSATENHHNG